MFDYYDEDKYYDDAARKLTRAELEIFHYHPLEDCLTNLCNPYTTIFKYNIRKKGINKNEFTKTK